MKRILLSVIAFVLIFALAGCGAGNVGTSPSGGQSEPAESEQTGSEAPALSEDDVQDNLDGLAQYLISNGLLGKDEVQNMAAAFIGAVSGKRYRYKVGNSNVVTELYEFDTASLSDTARDYISQAERDGKLVILEQEVAGVLMSDSGKYLMIYGDSSSDEEIVKRAEEAKAAFRAFKK